MKFDSKFDIKEVVLVVLDGKPIKATVGRILIDITDSPGRTGEKVFVNYKPKKKYIERYMCVETGIGTGQVYEAGKNIFKLDDKCLKLTKEGK